MAPVLGLCALLAADAVLISWAFRGPPAEDPALSTTRVATSSSPSVVSSAGGSTEPATAVRPATVTRFAAAVGLEQSWVVDAGTCAKPGTVWTTSDGGDSWSREDAPGRTVRAKPERVDRGFVTGGDRDCTLRLWQTGDAGRSWSGARSAAGAWSRVPSDDREVHVPSDQVRTPCGDADVLDLTTLDNLRAGVLCGNAEVRTTTDGGRTWVRAFTDKVALAIALAASGRGVVVRTEKGCAGVVAVALEDGQPSTRKSCVEVPPVEGKVSVATTGTAWWLVVGDVVLRSENAVGPWSRTGATLPSS